MKKLNYSITLFWDARVMNTTDKTSRIFLTVNLKGQQFRISLKLRSTKSEFEKARSSARVISSTCRELKKHLNDYVLKAEQIFERIPNADKQMFLRIYKLETDLFSSKQISVFYFFDEKLETLKKENRKGSYEYFKGCRNNIKKYKSNISIQDINETFLKSYQHYLKSELGNSNATVALRLRALKVIYNTAVQQGFINDSKPFKNVTTASTVRSKAVLYGPELKALWNYEPIGIRERRAKDFFFFLYLANGMNSKDAAYLKYCNIKGDRFTFIREKTKFTKAEVSEIVVHLNDEMKKIIDEWGNKNKSGYVFPILKGKTVFEQETSRTRHKRTCNKALAIIGKKLGFDVHLCLNLARHSFASYLNSSGVPVSFISDAMGHSNASMTEHYLKQLPSENLKLMSDKLLSFM